MSSSGFRTPIRHPPPATGEGETKFMLRSVVRTGRRGGGTLSGRLSRTDPVLPKGLPDLSAWSAVHHCVNVGRGVFADLKRVSIRVNRRLFFETLPAPDGHIKYVQMTVSGFRFFWARTARLGTLRRLGRTDPLQGPARKPRSIPTLPFGRIHTRSARFIQR